MLTAIDDPPDPAPSPPPPRLEFVAPGGGNGVSDGEPELGLKTAGPAVDLSAIGLGMTLLGKRVWTWVLAILVAGFAVFGLSIALTLVLTPVQWVLTPVLGSNLASAPLALIQFAALMALEGILAGGLYRMALRQLDGHEISVSDLFNVSDVAVKLGLVWVLFVLCTWIGLALLVIPGLIASGLLMFAIPLVVDGKLGPVDALRGSFEALKRDWLQAGLFVVILGFIYLAGVVPCGVGVLFTAPLVLLSTAAQYRRVFAPGAKQRRVVAPDPWADAVGLPLSERSKPRMPGLAWALFVLGLLVPVVMIAAFALFVGTMVRATQRQAHARPGFPLIEGQPGQLPPGFPKMELQPGQLPPGFPKMEIRPGQAPPGFPGAPPANVQPPGAAGANADAAPGLVPSDAALAQLSANLDSPDPATRDRALAALTRMPVDRNAQDAIAEKLQRCLKDPEFNTRFTAMIALRTWGRPADTPAMVAALDDPQPQIVRSALSTLGHHKDPAPLAPMLARASDKTLHRQLVSALRVWGPPLEPELLKHLNDDDPDVRQVVCEALRDIGSTASIIPLRNASRDPDAAVADKARSALEAIEKRNSIPIRKRTMVPRTKPRR